LEEKRVKKTFKRVLVIVLTGTIALSICLSANAASVKELDLSNIAAEAKWKNPNVSANKELLAALEEMSDYVPFSNTSSSIVALEMANDMLAVSSKTLLISYYSLLIKLDDLENSMELLYAAKNLTDVMYSLGLATKSSVSAAEKNIKDARIAKETLESSIDKLRAQMWNYLGEKKDSKYYSIAPYEKRTQEELLKIKEGLDYDEDYKVAKRLSYDIKSQTIASRGVTGANYYAEQTKLNDLIRRFDTNFDNVYNAFVTAFETLEYEDEKFADKKTDFERTAKKYELGLISKMDYLKAQNDYMAAQNALITASLDFESIYVKYEALKAGIWMN